MFDKRISPIYRNKMSFVEENINSIHKAKKLLDVGCGYGDYFHIYKKNKTKFTGIDTDKEAIKNIKEAVFCDAADIKLKSNQFDTAVCVDVIEHVDDPDKVVKEICRTLKKGGKLIGRCPKLS